MNDQAKDENQVTPSVVTKPNDNAASQNGLGQEFQDILNNGQQTGQGNGNDVQIPNQPTIVQGGSDVPNQPTLVQGGGVETVISTISPTAASIDPNSDEAEAGAEFGLDVSTSESYFCTFRLNTFF